MYRIRFHGRGGQGTKTASRILGTALFRSGFEVQDAPRYGAERRGAPIFAYVRADHAPIHERGVILDPDLVVVADATLVPLPAAGVLAGLGPRTVLFLNDPGPANRWRDRLGLQGAVVTEALTGAVEDPLELPYVGAACAGAAARLAGVIEPDALREAVREELADRGSAVRDENERRSLEAYERVAAHEACVVPGAPHAAAGAEAPAWIDLPFEGADVSAPAIHAPGTSARQPTGLWRTQRPVLEPERCHRCWWVCSTFCPENAISVTDGRPVVDYDLCKGCLVCVVQCPRHALVAVPEATAAGDARGAP